MKFEELEPILSKIRGVTFASMDTKTIVALKGGKKNPMKDRVSKVSTNHRIMLFTNQNSNGYENMVRRRLEKEGKDISFDVTPRVWGTRLPNLPVVEHNGKYYLEVIFLVGGKSEYFLDDELIPMGDIEGFPEQKSGSGRQGLDDEHKVVIRIFSLDSITAIRLLKEELHD